MIYDIKASFGKWLGVELLTVIEHTLLVMNWLMSTMSVWCHMTNSVSDDIITEDTYIASTRHFQQLRSYCNEIETRNQEEILFSSSYIVPRGLSFAERPQTAFHNDTYLYNDHANPLMGIQQDSNLRDRHRNHSAMADTLCSY